MELKVGGLKAYLSTPQRNPFNGIERTFFFTSSSTTLDSNMSRIHSMELKVLVLKVCLVLALVRCLAWV